VTTTRLPASHCLNCGKQLDAASDLEGERTPCPGDVTVCIDCGHVMAFADDMTMRALTDAEMIEVAGDCDLLKVQRALAAIKK
jgi:hypothetical protein